MKKKSDRMIQWHIKPFSIELQSNLIFLDCAELRSVLELVGHVTSSLVVPLKL